MVIPPTPRHDLLRALHELIQPKIYLEIGVQTGRSLVQARPGTISIGVDPNPQLSGVTIENPYFIFSRTSDDFFAEFTEDSIKKAYTPYDMVFIDGMHLIENVMRDYSNAVRWSHHRTVIIVDDVLPYKPEIASRTPMPGDWTGDVWKIYSILTAHSSVNAVLVDVAPTGLLIITGVNPEDDPMTVDHQFQDDDVLTQYELDEMRRYAVQPDEALAYVAQFLQETS